MKLADGSGVFSMFATVGSWSFSKKRHNVIDGEAAHLHKRRTNFDFGVLNSISCSLQQRNRSQNR